MKLVVTWSVGDGYTYCCDVVEPVEYESPEAFLDDWEQWKLANPKPILYVGEGFAGTSLDASIDSDSVNVYELEEWFDTFKPQGGGV